MTNPNVEKGCASACLVFFALCFMALAIHFYRQETAVRYPKEMATPVNSSHSLPPPISPSATPHHPQTSPPSLSVYYEEGYAKGYTDGEEDTKDRMYRASFQVDNPYKGPRAHDYEQGYEDGYEQGWEDNLEETDDLEDFQTEDFI